MKVSESQAVARDDVGGGEDGYYAGDRTPSPDFSDAAAIIGKSEGLGRHQSLVTDTGSAEAGTVEQKDLAGPVIEPSHPGAAAVAVPPPIDAALSLADGSGKAPAMVYASDLTVANVIDKT